MKVVFQNKYLLYSTRNRNKCNTRSRLMCEWAEKCYNTHHPAATNNNSQQTTVFEDHIDNKFRQCSYSFQTNTTTRILFFPLLKLAQITNL